MEEEIRELAKRIEDHEKRIKELENIIQAKDKKKIIEAKNKIDDVVEHFKSLNLSEHEYIYGLSGLSLYLAIILIAKEKLGIDGLAPSEISKICRDKIRISRGVDRRTIGNALTNAGANVDRITNPRGNGFAYRIMRQGESFIQELATRNQ